MTSFRTETRCLGAVGAVGAVTFQPGNKAASHVKAERGETKLYSIILENLFHDPGHSEHFTAERDLYICRRGIVANDFSTRNSIPVRKSLRYIVIGHLSRTSVHIDIHRYNDNISLTFIVQRGFSMPVLPQNNSRSGASQFLKFAATMCRLVNLSAPIIRAAFPTRTALLAVLTAAEEVCALLPAAQNEAAAADALPPEDFDPADDTILPGQDPE